MLGCDPEFELRKGGQNYCAYRVFSDRERKSFLGLDGCSEIGELRTRPGTPDSLVSSLSRSIGVARRKCDKVEKHLDAFAGAGKRYSLGGHLHFSHVAECPRLIKLLDTFVAEPLNRVSNSELRFKAGYGRLGSTRSNKHGWEYRSAPSWLSHPIIANGVLNIAEYLGEQNWTLQSYESHFDLTLETLSQKMNLKQAESVRLLNEMLVSIRDLGMKLEDIEMFRSWGKRKIELSVELSEEKDVVCYPMIKYHESLLFEPKYKDALIQVLDWYYKKEFAIDRNWQLRFSEAGRFRDLSICVHIPQTYRQLFPFEWYDGDWYIRFDSWENNGFGFSWDISENFRSLQIANLMKYIIQRVVGVDEDVDDTNVVETLRLLTNALDKKGVKKLCVV